MSAYRETCAKCDELQDALNDKVAELAQIEDLRAEAWRSAMHRTVRIAALFLGLGGLGICHFFTYLMNRPAAAAVRHPCRESAEVIDGSSSTRTCDEGATLHAEALSSGVLVRCVCHVPEPRPEERR